MMPKVNRIRRLSVIVHLSYAYHETNVLLHYTFWFDYIVLVNAIGGRHA